jgi:hypothetical protein
MLKREEVGEKAYRFVKLEGHAAARKKCGKSEPEAERRVKTVQRNGSNIFVVPTSKPRGNVKLYHCKNGIDQRSRGGGWETHQQSLRDSEELHFLPVW